MLRARRRHRGACRRRFAATDTTATTTRACCARPIAHAFYASYPLDVTPTTDDRPFFFHTTKLRNQFVVAFGRSMLFGNGLSALLALLGISSALIVAVHPRTAGRVPAATVPPAVAASGWPTSAPRRRLHADRGRAAPAVRAAARPPGLLADGDAVLAAARHRPRQPSSSRRIGDADARASATAGASSRSWRSWRCWRSCSAPLIAWAIPSRGRCGSPSRVVTLVPPEW